MNYILEINAFERQMRRSPLPTTAQLLWYKLMHFANVHYWPEWFSIDNDRLTALLNSGSDQTLRNARKLLVEKGYILYEKGVKGKPGRYKMCSAISIFQKEGENTSFAEEEAPEPKEGFMLDKDDVTKYFGYTEAAGLELKITTQQLFGTYLPNEKPTEQDELRVFHHIKSQTESPDGHWTLTFPKSEKELLAYAFEQASLAGAVNWNYIEGIYRNFAARGIKTVEQAYDYEAERDQRKGCL